MSFRSSSSALVRRVALLILGGLALGTLGCDGGGSSADPPAPPSNVEATSADGTVTLSWDGNSDATGYNVYRDTSPISEVGELPMNGDTPVESTSFTDDSAINGTRYYYRVTAVGDGGEGDLSSEVSARPFPSPPDDRP